MHGNFIQLTEEKLNQMLTSAAKLGAHVAMRDAGLPVREFYTRTEMARRHGAGTVNRLIRSGRLTPHRYPDGGTSSSQREVYSEEQLLSLII